MSRLYAHSSQLAMELGRRLITMGGILADTHPARQEQLYEKWLTVYNYTEVTVDGNNVHQKTDLLGEYRIDGLLVKNVGQPLHIHAKTGGVHAEHFVAVTLTDDTHRLLFFDPHKGCYTVYMFPSRDQREPDDISKHATNIFNDSRFLPQLQWGQREDKMLVIQTLNKGENVMGHLMEVCLDCDPQVWEWQQTYIREMRTIAGLPRSK